LQHLPNKEVKAFLPQLKKFKHCLITNDVDPQTLTSKNSDIHVGNVRWLDLTMPPFKVKGRKVLTYKTDDGRDTKQVLHIRRK